MTICGGPGVALAAGGPVDRDDSDKGRKLAGRATTGGARAAGLVSRADEASESAGVTVKPWVGQPGRPSRDRSVSGLARSGSG